MLGVTDSGGTVSYLDAGPTIWFVDMRTGQFTLTQMPVEFTGSGCTGTPCEATCHPPPQQPFLSHSGAPVTGEPVYRTGGPKVTVDLDSRLHEGACTPTVQAGAQAIRLDAFVAMPAPLPGPLTIHWDQG
jgi:hypothetical protein